jgi:hypothetical protein
MKKKQTQQQTPTLSLRRETLRRLDDESLQGAAGGGRLRVPVGFADDTTPLYDDTTG